MGSRQERRGRCRICGEAAATVHFTEIINDKISEMHLCSECAVSKGFQQPFSQDFFPLANLLSGLIDVDKAGNAPVKSDVGCPSCQLAYSEFKRSGRFGCADCYDSFAPHMAKLMRRLHGGEQHQGKEPLSAGLPRRAGPPLEQLRQELRAAIEVEHFEQAAQIRDEIKLQEPAVEDSEETGGSQ